MARTKRKMIRIDERKCDGCGLCENACPEGAIKVIDGKAKVVRESFCDGLGACLGECPRGALKIEERGAEEYDEKGVIAHLKMDSPELLEKHMKHLKAHEHEMHPRGTACPSAQVMQWNGKEEGVGAEKKKVAKNRKSAEKVKIASELRQWPVQLHLVPPGAPYLKNASLALVADCVPFAYGDFHRDFLKGNVIAVGCPKLDDAEAYIAKVTEILRTSGPKACKSSTWKCPVASVSCISQRKP